ncbi:MFS transporter (macronuclear) [Tetrahymena thermophila SB210]|uniref:MFS transporter n=1 Tax=Tetrahymena thermophila (strain SB210) TaxID=312017 RepID=I7M026_TETTS|nr:MFS transporter [Tetrahymena thermophila SB210]EAR85362.1 MFS transporter [Tetrahymena thermophila SB210]|eukprot:XP_001033025.1 MFS transporter [Tetrahymena thermophila SB210]
MENTEKDLKIDSKAYLRGKLKVVVLSFTFMALFSTFNSAQNLVGSLYTSQGYDDLGLISLFVVYIVFAFASFFANFFINKFSYKVIFFFSSLGYVAFAASGIWVCSCKNAIHEGACSKGVIYFIVLASAALCGFSASTIWVAQGGYIDSISQDFPNKKGTLFGIFWAINQGSQIVGNLMGMFILNYLDNLYYFLIMTFLGLGASFLFLLLPSVSKKKEENGNQVSAISQAKSVFVLMGTRKVRPFLPLISLAGVVVAFYSGFLSKLVNNSIQADTNTDDGKDEVSKKLSFVLIVLGCSEVISGIISGKLADKFNIYKIAIIATITVQIALLLSFLGLYTNSYLVCFFVAACWGFNDCFLQNVTSVICSKDYEGQLEIFQINRFLQSITVAIVQIINVLLKNSPDYIFVFIIFIFQMVTNYFTTYLDKKPDIKSTTTLIKANSDEVHHDFELEKLKSKNSTDKAMHQNLETQGVAVASAS